MMESFIMKELMNSLMNKDNIKTQCYNIVFLCYPYLIMTNLFTKV